MASVLRRGGRQWTVGEMARRWRLVAGDGRRFVLKESGSHLEGVSRACARLWGDGWRVGLGRALTASVGLHTGFVVLLCTLVLSWMNSVGRWWESVGGFGR